MCRGVRNWPLTPAVAILESRYSYLVRLGLHHVHHHADDVPGRAELAVDACRGDLGEQVFVHIAPGVGSFELGHLVIDAVHGSDDLIQHQGRRDLEDGVTHVFGVGALFITVEFFYKREDPFLHGAVHLPGGEVMEYTPLELAAVNGTITNLHFFGKYALIGQAEHGRFLGSDVVGIVQVMDEHQIGHLFNDVKRIRNAACPEDLPKAVDFAFQFTCYHVFTPSPSSMCRRYSGLRRF